MNFKMKLAAVAAFAALSAPVFAADLSPLADWAGADAVAALAVAEFAAAGTSTDLGNFAIVSQTGGTNVGYIEQVGATNFAVVSQATDANTGVIFQTGDSNQAAIVQH